MTYDPLKSFEDPIVDAYVDRIAGDIDPDWDVQFYLTDSFGVVDSPPGLPKDVINQTIRNMNDEGIGRFCE